MSRARHAAPKNLRARLETLRRTLADALPPAQVFKTDAGNKTVGQLTADLDAALAPFRDVDAKRMALDSSLQARKKAEPNALEVASRSVAVIQTALPRNHPLLQGQFLRRPGGAHKQTGGQKFIANLKRQRSRKLVGVMGKRQRAAKLKGG